jgi:lipoate-protein ligase A
MAIDEALFLSAPNHNYAGTLRVYQSSKDSVTIGYFQNIDKFDLDYLKSEEIDYVRRITGGRAVLHGSDLTFSFSANNDSPFYDSSINKITAKFAKIIKGFLLKLDIKANIAKKDGLKGELAKNSSYCFNSFTKSEILIRNKKIAGFALKKNDNSFLLQGSIPISLDHVRFSNIVKGNTDAGIMDRITCMGDCTDNALDFNNLKNKLVASFSDEGWTILNDRLTSNEENDIKRLTDLKYKNSTWTYRPKEFSLNMKGSGEDG